MNRFDSKMRELHAIPLGFDHGNQPILLTEEAIQEAERLLGERLPDDYREFVRDFGAFNIDALFPVREGYLSQAGIGYFKGIVSSESRRAFDWLSSYLQRNPQLLPDDAINIGWGGNIPIILFFKGENRGKVFIRDYEEFCLVADSFTEFMQLLENEFDGPDVDEDLVQKAASFWDSFSTR